MQILKESLGYSKPSGARAGQCLLQVGGLGRGQEVNKAELEKLHWPIYSLQLPAEFASPKEHLARQLPQGLFRRADGGSYVPSGLAWEWLLLSHP